MQIWVDADACPQVIKEILYRAADRVQILTTLVANTALRIPASNFIRTVRVPKGFDVADDRIVEQVQPGDLVITADIPLAADLSRIEGVGSLAKRLSAPIPTLRTLREELPPHVERAVRKSLAKVPADRFPKGVSVTANLDFAREEAVEPLGLDPDDDSVDAAIRAINDVRLDHYLMKPWDPPEEKLYPVVDALIETWRATGETAVAETKVVGHRWSAPSFAVRGCCARSDTEADNASARTPTQRAAANFTSLRRRFFLRAG